MFRPLPLVLALVGLASAAASAQEALAPLEPVALSSSEEGTKPTMKKTPAATEARKSAPPRLVSSAAKKPSADSESGAASQKSRRVTFVGSEDGAEAVEERPRSFWDRLFGRRKPRAATPAPATPAPVATPKPTAKSTPRPRKPKTTTASSGSSAAGSAAKMKAPAGMETPSPAIAEVETAPSVPKATPAPKTVRPKTGATAAAAPAATPARKAPVAPSSDADTEAQEKYRYEVAKEKALQDPEVQKLKERADGAASDDEARKAQRAYNKALFGKMRSVDSSIKDRADRIEAAILKRLDASE